MSKTAKTALSITAASLLMVFSLNTAFAKPGNGPDGAGPDTAKHIDKLKKELKLSDEQVAQMQSIVDSNRAEMEQLREEVKAMQEKVRAEMNEVLTEEQREKLDAKKAARDSKKEARSAKKDAEGGKTDKKGGRNNH